MLVWLLAAAASSQVRAACGDYVTVRHLHADRPAGGMLPRGAADGYLTAYFGGQSQLSRLLAAGLASGSAEYPEAEYPRPLPGCHGPSCSRHFPLPVDPLPGSNVGGGDQWACFPVRAEVPLRQPRLCEFGLRIHLSEGYPYALERPPCV